MSFHVSSIVDTLYHNSRLDLHVSNEESKGNRGKGIGVNGSGASEDLIFYLNPDILQYEGTIKPWKNHWT
jgi:hypothetical protein